MNKDCFSQIKNGFYKGKKVFVTGHTGFKGAWLVKILDELGAEVTGYALEPPTKPCLFEIAGLGGHINSVIGDIRDYEALEKTFRAAEPEIVLHLAAQPIVRVSYEQPRETYETNVMGTVNLLECVRKTDTVTSLINVTTDKVYRNKEWIWGYREEELLDGYDPYSNSKSCSELVTASYVRSFFSNGERQLPVSCARAGNVIGGGDFARDRIIPDCIRAVTKGDAISVRNPYSIRPYQHVLEPLFAYLMIAAAQYEDINVAGAYNVGPDECDCVTTGTLVDTFVKAWGENVSWENKAEANAPHEANFLKLDCTKLKIGFGWSPKWRVEQAIAKTVDWTKCWQSGADINTCMGAQIREYLEDE